MQTLDLKLAARAPKLDDRPLDKRVGLIALATDHTTEVDFQRMVANERIGVYATRIPYANPVTPANLRAMQPSLTSAAALILPDEPLDVVMYSCTSASVVIGDAEVRAAIRAAKPTAAVVTPTAAAASGLRAFGAKRIAVLTPYTIETSKPMADYFLALGFDLARFTCLGLTDDREMARISRRKSLPSRRKRLRPIATHSSSPARRFARRGWQPKSRLRSASRSSPATLPPPGPACAFAATRRCDRSAAA